MKSKGEKLELPRSNRKDIELSRKFPIAHTLDPYTFTSTYCPSLRLADYTVLITALNRSCGKVIFLHLSDSFCSVEAGVL